MTGHNLESNIFKYYIYSALRYSVFFFIPFIVIYMQGKGLSITAIMVLESIFAISVVALEIPTGALADIIGRKKTISLGAFFLVLGTLCFAYAESFAVFAIAESLYAVGVALASGAETALVYDTLKKLGKETQFKKIEGRAVGAGFFFAAVVSALGGFLYALDARLPFFVSAASIGSIIIVVSTMKEPNHYEKKVTVGETFETMKEGIRFTATHKNVRWLVLYTSFFAAFSTAMFWLYQPYLAGAGIDVVNFGMIFAAINIVVAVASFSAHSIEKAIGEKMSIFLIPSLTILTFMLLSSNSIILGALSIFIAQFVWGYSGPVIGEYVNRHVSSSNRATVLSVNSFALNITRGAVLPFVGFLVDLFSLSEALVLSALILLAINIVLYIARKL